MSHHTNPVVPDVPEDDDRPSWSTVFRRSRTNPYVFNVSGWQLYGVIEPGVVSSGMFSHRTESTALLDGLVIDTSHYGFGPYLGDGHHVIGFRTLRLLCDRLGLRPPRQLKGEPSVEPIEQLRALAEWQRTWPADLLEARADIGSGVIDSWGLEAAIDQLRDVGGLGASLEPWIRHTPKRTQRRLHRFLDVADILGDADAGTGEERDEGTTGDVESSVDPRDGDDIAVIVGNGHDGPVDVEPDDDGERVLVDQASMNERIAEQLGIDVEVVNTVIDVEIEYQVGVGICEDPDWEFRFWDPAELVGREPAIDHRVLAADAARFVGVDPDLAEAIYDAELDELDGLGLIHEDDWDDLDDWDD